MRIRERVNESESDYAPSLGDSLCLPIEGFIFFRSVGFV